MKLEHIISSDNEIIISIECEDNGYDIDKMPVMTVLTWTPPLHTPRPTCLQLAVSGGGRRGNL